MGRLSQCLYLLIKNLNITRFTLFLLCLYILQTLRKMSSLSVYWKTEGNPPDTLQALRPEPLQGTSALVHWGDWDHSTNELLDRVKPIVQDDCTSFTLTVSPLPFISSKKQNKERELANAVFYSLCKEDVVMELGANCEDYIIMYTGDEHFLDFKKKNKPHHHLRRHPMMKDVMALSDMALRAFDCRGDFERVICKRNVIYIALFYLNETPAYYVGKAVNGITERWCKQHFSAIDHIIHYFKTAQGDSEPVMKQQPCEIAIACAILRQWATGHDAGMALFAIDACPTMPSCMSDDQAKVKARENGNSLDHYEQHYMNAFAKLFADSDTEPKMKRLNVKESILCHNCSDENIHGCSMEVALSLFLHDLQLS